MTSQSMVRTPASPPPTLRLRVDRDAIADNWRVMNRLSGRALTSAAVKADAYGVGVARAVPALMGAGCRDFYVAHWSEVPAVSAHAPVEMIAALHGPANDADCAFARSSGVRPVLNSLSQVQRWVESGGGRCDLMVDTGMNRLGLRPEELGDPVLARLDVDVLMSHLACADEDSPMNEAQRAAFAAVIDAVPHRRTSLANSAGTALGEAYHFTMTRPGLSLYGGVPRAELAGSIRQVVVPEAMLIQVRTVPCGDTIGYGATFTAAHPMRVGVVSLGYADGYLRCWSGIGGFRHGDAELPVLGRVSMDMTIIDLTAAADLAEGDWVAAKYDLPEASARSGLTQYELLTVIGPRLRG